MEGAGGMERNNCLDSFSLRSRRVALSSYSRWPIQLRKRCKETENILCEFEFAERKKAESWMPSFMEILAMIGKWGASWIRIPPAVGYSPCVHCIWVQYAHTPLWKGTQKWLNRFTFSSPYVRCPCPIHSMCKEGGPKWILSVLLSPVCQWADFNKWPLRDSASQIVEEANKDLPLK